MELFKFIPDGTDQGFLAQGQFLNGIKTATWIERYREPGEVTITAPVSSGLRNILPPGTIISHTDTFEAMMIENIEIDEDVEDGEPEIRFTGRSLDAWLENRIVGEDIEHYAGLYLNFFPYVLDFDTSWFQARDLIANHINNMTGILTGNITGIVPIDNQQHIGSSTTAERIIEPVNVHRALMELLAIDDFGIKVVRPNPANDDPLVTEFRIHNGNDKTDSVIFSHLAGDLRRARYFWSNKSHKTDYYGVSTYFVVRSDSSSTGFNRRTMYVDCTDIDAHLLDTDLGDGPTVDAVGAAMYVRCEQALRAQTPKSIMSANINTSTEYKFRQHYDVGDIVYVKGNYDTAAIMRVTEHVEFLDETGESGYPTLSALNE